MRQPHPTHQFSRAARVGSYLVASAHKLPSTHTCTYILYLSVFLSSALVYLHQAALIKRPCTIHAIKFICCLPLVRNEMTRKLMWVGGYADGWNRECDGNFISLTTRSASRSLSALAFIFISHKSETRRRLRCFYNFTFAHVVCIER